MSEHAKSATIERVRRFSRFYTRRIGVLQDALLGSDLTLAEGRIVFEIATTSPVTAADLGLTLDLDPGYMSRLLKALEQRGIVARAQSETDARRVLLTLTARGRDVFDTLDQRSNAAVSTLVSRLTTGERSDLTRAFDTIERMLADPPPDRPEPVLRDLEPGDLGWIIHRHGALYAAEFGWDATFEPMVAKVAAEFVDGFDPSGDRAWVAEIDGRIAGSVFLVRKTRDVAKLRLLYVEPEARGHGLGRLLVTTCIEEARRLGYVRMTLWTNDVLTAARTLYQATGFTLVESVSHRSFGRDLIGETWERDL